MYENLEALEEAANKCDRCELCKNRNHLIFGCGPKDCDIMVIGEGPGEEEDNKGELFIGKSGRLMQQAFIGLGIDREKLYLTNIIKCKCPNNRTPYKNEINSCLDYLRNQVILIKPKIIVLMGNVALKAILGDSYGITSARGKWIELKGIKYLPTFHPAALLRDETKKIDFWNDFELVKKECDNLNIDISLYNN